MIKSNNDISYELDLPRLRELLEYLWANKWLVVFFTLLSALFSIFYALSIPNQYKSTAILAGNSSQVDTSGFAANIGGLASLAGVNVGGNSTTNNVSSALVVVKTWDFLENFVKRNSLEKQIYAASGWDEVNNKLIYDPEKYSVELNRWVNDKGEVVDQPSGWLLFSALNGRVEVARNKTDGLITLSVEHYSPYLAKEVLDLLIFDLNMFMQERDKFSAQKSIGYLTDQIKNTELSEMKSVFYQLIEEQTKRLMLAEVSNEYVLKVLSPSKIPVLRSKPNRTLIVVFLSLLGFVLISLLILIHFFIKKPRTFSEKGDNE